MCAMTAHMLLAVSLPACITWKSMAARYDQSQGRVCSQQYVDPLMLLGTEALTMTPSGMPFAWGWEISLSDVSHRICLGLSAM